LKAFKNEAVVLIFFYIFVISLIYHGIQQWLAVYFSTTLNLNQFTISSLITLTSLSGIFGEIFGGQLADSLGRQKVVSLGIIIMILSIFLMLFKLPLIILALVMVGWGLGWTFNHAGLATMLTDLPAELLNEAASLNSGVRFISGGIGVGISGLLMHKSFNLGFAVLGSVLFVLFISGRFVRLAK
jgi:predicted MFS family arabinose efflux permease